MKHAAEPVWSAARALVCPALQVLGVWRFVRAGDLQTACRSLPGHLLHLVRKGKYRLGIGARRYDVRAGDAIYYYECEEVTWSGCGETVLFDSVGFLAPTLPPLRVPEARVFRAPAGFRRGFDALRAAWDLPDTMLRRLRAGAALLSLLAAAGPGPEEAGGDRSAGLWPQIEDEIRRRRLYRATLPALVRLAGVSRATLVRLCRAETGESPMRRLRALRLEEANGLLRCSPLTIREIADYLGYGRVQEFSREYRRMIGLCPSRVRAGVGGQER